MADQDFNIKVVTTADTTGLKQTEAGIDAIKQKAQSAASTPVGLSGSAVGVGTIISLLTVAIRKWQEFDDGVNRAMESSIKAIEKFRELGDSIVEMQDKAINARRTATEPLEQSFVRLQQEIIRLKTEMNIAMSFGQLEVYKKLNAELGVMQSQLKGVTSELQKQAKASEETAAAAERSATAREREAQSFLQNAIQTSSPQVQAALKQEEAARFAREKGNEAQADLFQKSADRFKASMTPSQLEEYEGITTPIRLGRKAGIGESQTAIDDIERNRINNQRALAGQPPLPPGAAQGNDAIRQAIQQAFDQTMAKYWGP